MLGLDTAEARRIPGSRANTRESEANSGTIEIAVFKHDKSAL